MKTCVIYSGHARTIAELPENHWFFVLRKLPSPTIFCSVANDPRADDMLCLQRDGVEFHMEKVVQPEISAPVQRKHHFGYPVSSSPLAVLRQMWALNRAWEFVGERVNEFDLFLRIRPDLRFCRFDMPMLRVVGTDPWGPTQTYPGVRPDACFTPPFSTWGGINDRVALMGRKAASAYFTTFSRLQQLLGLGCPIHTETMMGTSLEEMGIKPSATLNTQFIILREDGAWAKEETSLYDLANYARTRL